MAIFRSEGAGGAGDTEFEAAYKMDYTRMRAPSFFTKSIHPAEVLTTQQGRFLDSRSRTRKTPFRPGGQTKLAIYGFLTSELTIEENPSVFETPTQPDAYQTKGQDG